MAGESVVEPKLADRLAPSHSLSPGQRVAVTVGIMMGLFLAAIDQTVVSTAMPTVVSSLGGLHIYSWVFSAYLLAFTVTIPIWGRLSDLHGRRPYYLGSVGLFLLGSVLAGQARSMGFLVFSRLVQGLGAGGLFPIGFTIVGEIYSLEQRARMQGLFSGVWGFASIVGPLAGGLITDHLSWRWVFYVNVPFGVAAAVLIHRGLSEPQRPAAAAEVDYAGVGILSLSLTVLLLGLLEGGRGSGFLQPEAAGLIALALVLFALFARNERRAGERALVPVVLLQNRIFRVSAGIGFLTGMGLFGTISFIPLFVQGVLFGSATRAGSSLTPLLLAWVFLSIASGRLILVAGYRPAVVAGGVFFAAGFLWLMQIGPQDGFGALLPPMVLMGAGMGLVVVAVLLAVQNSVPRRMLGIATSATVFFRTIGGAVGVALMGSVMSHRMTAHLTGVTDERLQYLALHPDVIVNEATRQSLSLGAQQWLRTALDDALHAVFICGLVIAVLSLLFSLRFPSGSARDLAANREGGVG
jgi:EmrB/QacA subfamily drug resistance transporter